MVGVQRRGVAASEDDVENIAKRPFRLGGCKIEAADQALPGRGVWDGVENRVEGEQRVAGEVHLRDEPRQKARPKKGKMNVGRAPGVVVIAPGIGAGLD